MVDFNVKWDEVRWWSPELGDYTNLSEHCNYVADVIKGSYKYYPRRYLTLKVLGEEMTMCFDTGYSPTFVRMVEAPKQALWECCCDCCDKDFTALMQQKFQNSEFEYEVGYKKPNNYRRTFYIDLFDGTSVIEIKASKSDMHTGYGQNFFGKYNYMLTRPTLVEYAERVLDEEGFDYVGVVSVADSSERGEWHIHRKARRQRNHYL